MSMKRVTSSSFVRAQRPGSRGLSLAEMLVAIFVVAVGILGTVSALWFGIRSERFSERRTNAVFQGRELINNIRSNGYAFNPLYTTPGSDLNDGDYDNDADDNGPRRPFNDPPFANHFPNNPFNFRRRVEIKRLSTDSNNHLSHMAAIKVSVYWDEGSTERKVVLWAYQRQ